MRKSFWLYQRLDITITGVLFFNIQFERHRPTHPFFLSSKTFLQKRLKVTGRANPTAGKGALGQTYFAYRPRRGGGGSLVIG